MRQVAQRPRDGRIDVVDAPPPMLRPGWVLAANRFSLISAGTERSKLDLGSKNLVQKARARPDLVRTVVDKARVEGVRSTVGAVRERLGAYAELGYSSAGVVVAVGEGVDGLAPGDEVALAGAGFANHAELVCCPSNLVARVPAGVSLEAASYATVGAIALHGVRQAEAAVGERVGVIGLGLVGQLALRILRAAGCEAVGIDPDPTAVELARSCGAHAFARDAAGLEHAVAEVSEGLGLDSVVICAAARSADPVELACRLVRDRGRLVVVGDVLVAADRALLYEKEIELRLSRSYGPGRYDRDYEERGRDLPAGYVRWTEQRNLAAFLGLIAAGSLDPSSLTTHRFPLAEADAAYAALRGETDRRPFGILLEYPLETAPLPRRRPASTVHVPGSGGAIRVGLIGAGSFARGTILPALRAGGARLELVATAGGLSAADVAGRFGFAGTAATAEDVVADDAVDAIVIATRHSEHARLAAAALRAGKAVFCEKPLALGLAELQEVEDALTDRSVLMVGFNRRFAPLTQRLLQELGVAGRRTLSVRVNAGPLPHDHWLNDAEDGGGRLLGEGCHFVDLLAHLAGSRVVSVHAVATPRFDGPVQTSDDVCATLRFENGSVGALVYTGSGDVRMPKELVEVFAGGCAAAIDDFRRLEIYRGGRRERVTSAQDKGHRAQIARFLAAARGTEAAPDVATYLDSTRATLALVESLRMGSPVELR